MKYNKTNPPPVGLTLEEFEREVDVKSFPKCESCDNPILNPEFYDMVGMCGPCTTGEADTLFLDPHPNTKEINQ